MSVNMKYIEADDDVLGFSHDLQVILERHAPLVNKTIMIGVLAQYVGVLQRGIPYTPEEFSALVECNICTGRDAC